MRKKINELSRIKFTFKELMVITLSFSLLFCCGCYFLFKKTNNNDEYLFDIEKTYKDILKNYYEDVDSKELADKAILGMMGVLNEKYSLYMDEDSATDLNNKLEGEYKGIGIQIGNTEKGVVIYNVFKDSPAFNAGIKFGDIIVGVDDNVYDENTKSDEIVTSVGDKKQLKLKVKREDEILEFDVKIESIDIPIISSKVYKKGNKKIGYIYIKAFSSTADKQVKKALNDMEDIDALILDVRSNTGGYLNTARNIASLFINKGKILYSLETKGEKQTIYDLTDTHYDKKVVVLVDSNTASASEVLAASLKESYGALIIGMKTYGKGRVQQTNTLSDNSMIKYTSAKWFSPTGKSYDGVGVEPGIYVNYSKKFLNKPSEKNDDQLKKALDILKEE